MILKEILNRRPNYEEEKKRCAFIPHHAIVFFDRKKNIKAWIDICFTCNEAIVAPGQGTSFDSKIIEDLYGFFQDRGLLPNDWKSM